MTDPMAESIATAYCDESGATADACPCRDRCPEHVIPRSTCSRYVHYTPAQAAAYVRAILSHPDAKKARNGGPVPSSLL